MRRAWRRGDRGAVDCLAVERSAQPGFDQAEDQQRDPDDAHERVDAVVVVQEDRTDRECLVWVGGLDDLLVLVEADGVSLSRGSITPGDSVPFA